MFGEVDLIIGSIGRMRGRARQLDWAVLVWRWGTFGASLEGRIGLWYRIHVRAALIVVQ